MDDDFFQLGGSSIKALLVCHRLKRALDVSVSVADVFSYKTISRLLAKYSSEIAAASGSASASNIVRSGAKRAPLSYAQNRLWFLYQLEPDSSAYHIVGPHLAHLAQCDRQILYHLAGSPNLWERRIAIMATFHFIRKNQFNDTLTLAEQLLNDREDLIHKAVGWMLREIGKRDCAVAESFLQTHYRTMPRTMLRYAIEKFPEPKRQQYLC